MRCLAEVWGAAYEITWLVISIEFKGYSVETRAIERKINLSVIAIEFKCPFVGTGARGYRNKWRSLLRGFSILPKDERTGGHRRTRPVIAIGFT